MLKFRFLPKIALADVAFEAYGKTPAELFENAACALEKVMVDFAASAKCKEQSAKLRLEAKSLEELLFGFLNELVFLKDSKQLLIRRSEIGICPPAVEAGKSDPSKADGNWYLEANLLDEKIDPARHKLHTDVKAVTKHLFEVKKGKDLWKARVVLDV